MLAEVEVLFPHGIDRPVISSRALNRAVHISFVTALVLGYSRGVLFPEEDP